MGHLHVTIDTVKLKSVARHLVKHQRRTGRNPGGAADQSARVAVTGGIASDRLAVFIEVPERHQSIFIAVEASVFEVVDFGDPQRTIPHRDLINVPQKTIAADLKRVGARLRPGETRRWPRARTHLDAVQIKGFAGVIYR